MAGKTHAEMVLDEVIAQWPARVEARARLQERPLGHENVSDERSRKLWWQTNPAAAQTIAQSPPLTPWEITKLMYPQREILWESAKNEGGLKGGFAFVDRMNSRRPETTLERSTPTPFAQPEGAANAY